MQNPRSKVIFIAAIVLVAALSRIIPHPMNVAPLGAMALFGAAYFGNRGLGLLITMVAWFVSDLVVNNVIYALGSGITWVTPGSFFIYLSIVLIYLLGALVLANKITLPRVIAGSLGASILFFMLSNLGVWLSGIMYPVTYAGLIACYTAALPFFQNTVLGDLVYSGLLFMLYEKVLRSQLISQKVEK